MGPFLFIMEKNAIISFSVVNHHHGNFNRNPISFKVCCVFVFKWE